MTTLIQPSSETKSIETVHASGKYQSKGGSGLAAIMAAIAMFLTEVTHMQGVFADLTSYIAKAQADAASANQRKLQDDVDKIKNLSQNIQDGKNANGKMSKKEKEQATIDLAKANNQYGVDQTAGQTVQMALKPSLENAQGFTGQLSSSFKTILDMSPVEFMKWCANLMR
jgi:hypothetical protein